MLFRKKHRREAVTFLTEHMARYRAKPREQLLQLLDEQDTFEIKGDSEKLGNGFSKDLARASKDRDTAILALKDQVMIFMDKAVSQYQSNFEVLVEVLRDIKCDSKK